MKGLPSSRQPRPRHLQHILTVASQSKLSASSPPTGNLMAALDNPFLSPSPPVDDQIVPIMPDATALPSASMAWAPNGTHSLCLSCEAAPRQTLFAPCGHVVLCRFAAPLISCASSNQASCSKSCPWHACAPAAIAPLPFQLLLMWGDTYKGSLNFAAAIALLYDSVFNE